MNLRVQRKKRESNAFVQFALFCVVALVIAGCGRGTGESIGQVEDSGIPLGAAVGSNGDTAPSIEAISLGCDLVTESIGINAGVDTNFTLLVDDEAPLALSYSIASEDESTVMVDVDANGVFTLRGLSVGNTTLPIKVTNAQGLSDQLLLNVIVN